MGSIENNDSTPSNIEEESLNCNIEWYNVDPLSPILNTKGRTGKAVVVPSQEIVHPFAPEVFTFVGWNSVRQNGDVGTFLSNKELIIPEDVTSYKLFAVYKYKHTDCLIKEDGSTISMEQLINDENICFTPYGHDGNSLELNTKQDYFKTIGKYSLIFDKHVFQRISYKSFKDDSNLKCIAFTDTTTLYTVENGFQNCTSLKYVNFPNTVGGIESKTFLNCSSLEVVYLSTGLLRINNDIFQNCTSLKSIVIPKGVNNIWENAFKMCTSLVDVSIPDTVWSYAYNIFDNCTSLEKITLPKPTNSEPGIELRVDKNNTNNMFNGCTNLKIVNFTGTVEEFKSIQNWETMGFNSIVKIHCTDGIIDPNK